MKFGTTETEYGEKITIKFDYDEDLVQDIKAMPWKKTHRAWNNEEKRWEIDKTQEAIKLFEKYTDFSIPLEYKSDSGEKPLRIVIPEGYSWYFINDVPPEVNKELDRKFSYKKPGAKYSDKYQSGEWDGKVHLYSTKHSGAPVGLLKKTENHLKRLGYDTKIVDRRNEKGLKRDFDWNFTSELRDYQKEAVNKAMKKKRGIISFPTGAGKTLTALRLIYNFQERAIIFVHTKELLYQWEEEIKETLGVNPGLIGDGNWKEGSITIAVIQTLMSRGVEDLDEGYGILIFDECHRTSAAEEMSKIGMGMKVKKRYGLSATPWRRIDGEELKIEGAIGEKVAEVEIETLIEEGFLAEPVFETITNPVRSKRENYQKVYRQYIVKNRERNKKIVEKAKALREKGFKIFIDVKRIDHGERLEEMLDNAIFLNGSDDTEVRESVLSRFGDPEENFILVSTLLKEGVDIPNMSAIILAGGGQSSISVIQTVGRALRPKNGEKARIVDIEDKGPHIGAHYRKRRSVMKNYYGKYYLKNKGGEKE